MLELFIANKNYSSWSLRPWVLMEERSIPFEECLVPFYGKEWKDFVGFAPTGQVPLLVDKGAGGSEEPGRTVVWDSLAIVEYLAERDEGVWPGSAEARAFARSAAAEMHAGFAGLRTVCSMNVGVIAELHEHTEALGRDVARVDALWSEGLRRFGGPFLAGDSFTAVDAFYAPVAYRVRTYGLDLGEEAAAYCSMLLERETLRSWEEAALAEPWREPAHEEELRSHGKIVEDRRVEPG